MTTSKLGLTARILLLIVCGVGISSCAGTRFDPRGCPTEKKYTKAEQEQFLRDLPKSPKSVQDAFVDYGRLRDKARACRGESF